MDVGDPGSVLVVGNCGGAREGQTGKKNSVRNKENTITAFVSFLLLLSVILIPG